MTKGRTARRVAHAASRAMLLTAAVAIAFAPLDGVAHAADTSIAGARAAAGLPPLRLHPGLEQVATWHAHSMATSGTVSHADLYAAMHAALERPPARIGQIAGAGGTVTEVESTFLASETHRANILGDFDAVGTGVATSGDGRVWVSGLFVKEAPVPAARTAPARAPEVAPTTTASPPRPVGPAVALVAPTRTAPVASTARSAAPQPRVASVAPQPRPTTAVRAAAARAARLAAARRWPERWRWLLLRRQR